MKVITTKIKKLTSVVFLILLFAFQGLAKLPVLDMDGEIPDNVTFVEAVKEISTRFEVFFTFDLKLVEGIEVNAVFRELHSLEDAVEYVLQKTSLKYRIIQTRYVIIYKDDIEGLESLREISHHLDGLISEGERTQKVKSDRKFKTTDKLTSTDFPKSIKSFSLTVEGIVVDDQGDPLIGVNIQVKGTDKGTATDFDGRFILEDIHENAVLVVSYIGYQTQEVAVIGKSNLAITLLTDSQLLDEVVVVGYGSQKKVSLTGSVSAVGNEVLTRIPVLDVSNSIAGLLPGVIALNRTGRPGSNKSEILIRGRNTTGNNSPLVLVDGVPYADWGNINSENIESISVLKDASAAIYGAQAGNGVILITTKRGKTGKPTVSLSINQGISQLTRVPENAGSPLYAEFVNQRAAKDGRPPFFSKEDIQKYKDGTDPFYPNTDWYAETLHKYVPLSKHNISIDGGTNDVQYLISGSYSRENGIFKESDTYFKNMSLISRMDATINSIVKLGLDLNYRHSDNYDEGDAFSSLASILPTEPVYWPNGVPSAGIEHGANPVMQSTIASGYAQTIRNLFSIKGSFDIVIPIIKGLGVDGYVNYSNSNTNGKNWQTPWITNSYNHDIQEYAIVPSSLKEPQLRQNSANGGDYLINARLYYNKVLDRQQINAFVAVEQSEGKNQNYDAFRRYFLSSSIDQLFAGGLEGMTNTGSASESGRQNIFGRLSYNFGEKYLFDFNFRYDGSYKFPEGNRWGFFPGGSAAWRISEENFIKDNYSFIDNLKVRVSYGKLGNDAVSAFQFLSLYSLGQTGYNLGRPVKTYQGLTAGVTPNLDITWEVAQITNLGVDVLLWDGLFEMNVDLFKQRRSNILATRNLAVPKFIGLDLPNQNIGVVENKGAELVLSHSKLVSDFSYLISGNIAYQKSKIIDIDEAKNIPDYQKIEGHPVGAEAYYHAIGIFRTQEEIENTPHPPGTVLGDLIYEDYNNDGTISSADTRVFDRTPYPEITFGLNLSMSYKQFSIWGNFAGQSKAWAYFHKHSKGAGHNLLKELAENRYTPGSMDSKYPNIPDSEVLGTDISGYKSTFWLQDVSFVRLKTMQLSYTLPRYLLSKANIGSAKLFVSGSNLFTIDKLKWFDPEGTQIQGKFYPQTKNYNFGINLSF